MLTPIAPEHLARITATAAAEAARAGVRWDISSSRSASAHRASGPCANKGFSALGAASGTAPNLSAISEGRTPCLDSARGPRLGDAPTTLPGGNSSRSDAAGLFIADRGDVTHPREDGSSRFFPNGSPSTVSQFRHSDGVGISEPTGLALAAHPLRAPGVSPLVSDRLHGGDNA